MKKNTLLVSICGSCLLAVIAHSGALAEPTHVSTPTLEQKVQKLEDIYQIEQLASRSVWYYTNDQHGRIVDELFAMDEPDVSWGENAGYWVGPANVRAAYVDWWVKAKRDMLAAFHREHPDIAVTDANLGAGNVGLLTIGTPIIEVAGDGQTAKGLWYLVGNNTMIMPDGKGGSRQMWERYALDFKKVHGQWKIWHTFLHTDLALKPGQDWAPDSPEFQALSAAPPKDQVPNGQPPRQAQAEARPARFAPPAEIVKVPVPYYTFSETFSYGPPTYDKK